MDHLKHFLDSVCEDSSYMYEQVENLAEIYQEKELLPVALIEWRSTAGFIVRFRIGVSSRDIATLSRDMAEVDTSLIFDEDFIIDKDYGYLYGEEATQAFISRIQNNIQEAQMSEALDGVTYISQEPLITPGLNIPSKTKIEKYWGDDF